MITRVCISINNQCNLACDYCHFREKKDTIQKSEMDVFNVLNNIMDYIDENAIKCFKIGFVGNGEPLLSYDLLQKYIVHIDEYLSDGRIEAYTITNGTLIESEHLMFFKEHNVNVGFSIDGIPEVHNKFRCNSYDAVIKAIELYRIINNKYPSMNCTVGKDVINNSDKTIDFFEKFNTKVTFSRMIGTNGISLAEFNEFLNKAQKRINVRTGGYDCTMYGGKCGAGINNLFYANGNIYLCGNCIDMPPICNSDTPLADVRIDIHHSNRDLCYKESVC